MSYLFVGHRPDSLTNGRPLAFGDVVSDDEAAANERLTRAELLVPVAAETPAETAEPAPEPAAPAKPKGRTTPLTDSEEE